MTVRLRLRWPCPPCPSRLDSGSFLRYQHATLAGGAAMGAYVWIAIGSALGGVARHWCGVTASRLWPISLPWGTIAINILGSFVIGLFASLTAEQSRFPLPVTARQFVMVGLCGGYTTFSSFSLQTAELLRAGAVGIALLNVGLSVLGCVTATAIGIGLAGLAGDR